MLLFKEGVDATDVSREVWYALGVAAAFKFSMWRSDLVVTALRNGQHMKGSLHLEGRAADIRTHDLSQPNELLFMSMLKSVLAGQGFDIVEEAQGTPGASDRHLHIEWDPRGRPFSMNVQQAQAVKA